MGEVPAVLADVVAEAIARNRQYGRKVVHVTAYRHRREWIYQLCACVQFGYRAAPHRTVVRAPDPLALPRAIRGYAIRSGPGGTID
jgi:hypothetical protein